MTIRLIGITRQLVTLIVLFTFQRIKTVDSISPQNEVRRNTNLWTRRQLADRLAALSSSTLLVGTSNAAVAQAGSGPALTPAYFAPGVTAPQAGRFYYPTLTPPFQNRATIRYALGRDAWAFEQLLTLANVTASIRCNVVKLQSTGGLWVHSPQWPTGEFCELLRQLEAPVEHVVLPCNALEHKAPMKAFLSKFPTAQVWIAPGQYGPFGSCGRSVQQNVQMGYRVDGIFGDKNGKEPSWVNEFDMATLFVDLPQNAGPVSEVAFCHRPTKTLIATDAVVFIPSQLKPPEIFSTYFDDITLQDPTFWPRTTLQAVFLPLRSIDDNIYPGFDALKDRLVRAPILRAFADARAPEAVREWIDQISRFDFDRILTSHFASPIAATPKDFAEAYGYLTYDDNISLDSLPPIACQDWAILEGLNKFIAEYKLGAPTVFDYTVGCK